MLDQLRYEVARSFAPLFAAAVAAEQAVDLVYGAVEDQAPSYDQSTSVDQTLMDRSDRFLKIPEAGGGDKAYP